MVDVTPLYIFHNIIDPCVDSNTKISKMFLEQRKCYKTNTLEIVYMFRIEISKNKMFQSQISMLVFIRFHCVEYMVQWWTGLYSSENDLWSEFIKFLKGFLKHKTPKETKVMTLENCTPQFSFYWPRMSWNMYVFCKRDFSCSNKVILRKTQKIRKNSWWHNVYFRFYIVMSWYNIGNVSHVIQNI